MLRGPTGRTDRAVDMIKSAIGSVRRRADPRRLGPGVLFAFTGERQGGSAHRGLGGKNAVCRPKGAKVSAHNFSFDHALGTWLDWRR